MKNIGETLKEIRGLIKNKNFSDARILAEQAIRNYQSNAELNFLLGYIYSNLQLTKRAQKQFEQSIYIDPNFYDALVELSFLYEKLGMHEKASNFRERAFRISQKISES